MGVCVLAKFRVSFLRIPVSCHFHLQPAAMSKMKLPDRWTDYIPVGKRIPGTRFIAFKVPLTRRYDHRLAPWQRFSPTDLIKEVENQNEELGLVVDLTCTKRYYSPWELPEKLEYSKIFTIGHEVPSDNVIAEFTSTVTQFLTQNSENDKLVGVHCTHGLNRTGYLVCRYLIDVLSMEPSEAIEKFNNSRGHSIERKNYLNDLLNGKTESAGLAEPRATNPRRFPKKNNFSHPGRQQEAHGYHNPNARWGSWDSRPSFNRGGGKFRGPQQRYSPYAGNYNGHHHHPQRPFPQHSKFDEEYGESTVDHRQHFSQQRGHHPGNRGPYQRYQRRGHKKKPMTPQQ
ncbi:RNA/RNP complex-1-interacting phosphatase isoform X2 [Engystomops pustulosus]|uniref:RNA/RNP complex-1-interacting phosphatase isoform X2 n=1 Tax=Engystomops pustulosus TaxID=76066 RepID=UPI003AFA7BA7